MDKGSIDIFLELFGDSDKDRIPGETLDSQFSKNKAIEISEFKFDGDSAESRSKKVKKTTEKGPTEKSDESSEGKGPYCKFEISKIVDSSSTFLMKAYCLTMSASQTVTQGPNFTKAKVSVRKAGAGQLTFLELIFGGVSVISYGIDVKSETPEESVVFKFETIEMFYYSQSAEGTLNMGDQERFNSGWNFKTAEELKV